MRANLLHPIGERRHARRARRSRSRRRSNSGQGPAAVTQAQTPAQGVNARGGTPEASEQGPQAAPLGLDIAARRVREAGGPSDRASYACACGYLFAASVSTTVECPHCGASQAW